MDEARQAINQRWIDVLFEPVIESRYVCAQILPAIETDKLTYSLTSLAIEHLGSVGLMIREYSVGACVGGSCCRGDRLEFVRRHCSDEISSVASRALVP